MDPNSQQNPQAVPPQTPPPTQPVPPIGPQQSVDPASQPAPQSPPVVHVVRAVNPEKPVLSQEVIQRHEESKELYPHLNLSEGEYVLRAVRRHPIGLIGPIAVGTFLIALAVTLLLSYNDFAASFNLEGALASVGTVAIPILLFIVLIILGVAISTYVYLGNKFFLTNESVIQEIQHSLFARHEQTVSLANIEDASFTKNGIIQYFFDYGEIRLSTQGDETTYHFSYVAGPKNHVAQLNNAVEAFKNGRPVDEN